MKDDAFELVGNNYDNPDEAETKFFLPKLVNFPWVSSAILFLIIAGCVFADLVMNHDPVYMDLSHVNVSPNHEFYFGTDSLGRDIFSMIWYGGRISLFIGIFSTVISTLIAVVYGSISGLSNDAVDDVLMRFTEILLSVPSILVIIFLQAMMGQANPWSISLVIGLTSWMNIAKIVRSEVRQIRTSEYILAAKFTGAGFFYILRWHLLPNFISAIMFMVVINIGSAIATESTLSFLGIGLPIEVISWGSMLSLAEKALLSNYWWIILIPGIFLVITLVCITNLGDYIRKSNNKEFSNL